MGRLRRLPLPAAIAAGLLATAWVAAPLAQDTP
jgi:hypothetical protein